MEDIEDQAIDERATGDATGDATREEVACGRCGDFVASDALVTVEGASMCEACVRASGHRPWNPRLIAGLSFLLGFGGAGVVHSLNQRRLGRHVRVGWRIVGWVAAFVLVCTVMAFLPEDGGGARVIGYAVNLAGVFFFARSGKERFDAYQAAGGATGKWYSAVGIGLGTTAAVAVAVVIGVVVYATARFEQGQQALDAGDHDRAWAIFDAECDQGEPAACTNVGWIAEQRGEYDTARRYYARSCELDGPMGCNNLGGLHEAGRGAPLDLVEARRLYERACRLGEPLGCESSRRL